MQQIDQTESLEYAIQMVYEDMLPYEDFAFRLPQELLHRLPEILAKIVQSKTHQQGGSSLVRSAGFGSQPL